jgi:hypothetical protein
MAQARSPHVSGFRGWGFPKASPGALTNRFAAQAGKGSATLSMAYAAAKFAESCLRAIGGEPVVECAYVESHLTELPFFASCVCLGRNGVEVRAWPPYCCRAKIG